MVKRITALLLFMVCSLTSAQESESNQSYYIDVLLDADGTIYFEDQKTDFDEVAQVTRTKVDNLPFVVGKPITYRIFADARLKLGKIIDVQERMYKGFSQPNLPIRKYLLEPKQVPLDKNNWIDQLNKLDLKAID